VIAFVDGILIRAGTEAVIAVGEGAVGLDLLLSARGAGQLPQVGERVKLWTHLSVREDGWTLFGFPSVEERTMFRLLVSVSGVGPKVALGMLSGAAPADIARDLANGDEKALARLPGIGKKSAARLVVELGQRVPSDLVATVTAATPAAGAEGPLTDALAVLAAMGLPAARAETLLETVRQARPELADDAQAWVRAALTGLDAPGR
jgi:Holliday junction DNA helicase RuvA